MYVSYVSYFVSLNVGKFYLDCILGKRDQLFKFTVNFSYLGMEELPYKFLVESLSTIVYFLGNKTRKKTAGTYLISISEIVNGVHRIGMGTLLIVNNCILGLIWDNDSMHLFDPNIKAEKDNLSSSGTAALSKVHRKII